MIDDPAYQRAFKTDVVAGFLRFKPLVPVDFFTLGMKFTEQV